MKDLIRSAQAGLAQQLAASGIATRPDVVRKVVSAAVVGASMSMASMMPGTAMAQYDQDQGQVISNGANQAGRTLGYEIGRRANVGNESANAVGTLAEGAARVGAGQNVDQQRIGQVVGGTAGAAIGFLLGGKNPVGRAVGAATLGALGAVGGGRAGEYLESRTSGAANAYRVTEQDQALFVQSYQHAAQHPIRQRVSRGGAPNGGFGQAQVMVLPEEVGMNGALARAVQSSGMNLNASGTAMPSDNVIAGMSARSMELIKVGEAYRANIDRWDDAFAGSASPMVKQELNQRVQQDWRVLQQKAVEYVQARNASALRGFDVTAFDGAVGQRLQNLRAQTDYRFNAQAQQNRNQYNY